MRPTSLDHVAFWVADRAPIARFLERYLGMHEIDRQETFTLLGADARRGKLTLFDAPPEHPGPRERGAFVHVGLRVTSLERARAALPPGAPETLDAGEGICVRLVEDQAGADYDLDHVALAVRDPESAAGNLERYGFRRAGPTRVEVGGAFVELHPGGGAQPERPLLNHLAVLVDSAEEHVDEARRLGIEVESVVDAPNTIAAFLRGPDGVRIEYVEHKPTFDLS
jgi:catechol 2,3-dioxygenase-like lactoylglutathione lyase family enzyme